MGWAHTEQLDAADLGEDLLGENLIGGGHFDFALSRHVVRLDTDNEITVEVGVGLKLAWLAWSSAAQNVPLSSEVVNFLVAPLGVVRAAHQPLRWPHFP